MKRKWKILSALCMTAALTCLIPTDTVLAAQDPNGTAREAQEEGAPDIVIQQAKAAEAGVQENAMNGENAQKDAQSPVSAELSDELAPQDSSAPVIGISLQGENRACALGGEIVYGKYIDNIDQKLSVTVDQAGGAVLLSYYLADDGAAESMTASQLFSCWQETGTGGSAEIALNKDGKYVLYVKVIVEGVGGPWYARTDGIVVDTIAPVIEGVNNGGIYPAGTKFTVSDANLDMVKINEQPVLPLEDGSYEAATGSPSAFCVIRAKDKAGHETVCGITIGEIEEKPDGEPDDKPEEKPEDDISVISENGTYTLKAGTAYQFGGGKWKLAGDRAVYQGGQTFYAPADGEYVFEQKR